MQTYWRWSSPLTASFVEADDSYLSKVKVGVFFGAEFGNKESMDNRHNKYAILDCKRMLAQSVAVIAGAIAECENHPCSFVNLGNPDAEEAALEIANSVFSGRGNSGVIFRVVFSNSKDMEDMIKQVISESGSTCPSCTTVTCKVAKSRKGNN